jgi:hypothetical protein
MGTEISPQIPEPEKLAVGEDEPRARRLRTEN